MRRLGLILLLLVAAASAQNQYFVSPTGSDSNNCTSSGTACRTLNHTQAVIAAGAYVVNVAPGNYPEALTINKSGSSSTQRGVWKCTVQWSVPSSGGCQIRTGAGTIINIAANNIDIGAANQFGFDMSSNGALTNGIVAACNLQNPAPNTGQCNSANSVHVLGNYIHDLSNTVSPCEVNPNGHPGIIIQNRHGPFVSDLQIIGNRITNLGNQSLSKLNGGPGCINYYAMYVDDQQAIIENNVIANIAGYGIHYYSSPCKGVISNNTVVRTELINIIIGGGDCGNGVAQGNITVSNNILGQNPAGVAHITIGVPGGGGVGSAGHTILVANNLFVPDGHTQVQIVGTSFTTVQGSLTEPSATTFASYTGGNNDDFHLKAGSLAINSGTPTCVSGGITPCTPATDFSGATRSTIDMGVYEFGGGGCTGGTVTLTPSLIGFGNSLVGVTSNAIPAVLTNTTCGSISIVSTALGGTNPADFAFTAPGATLASGASINIPVTIKPLALGNRTATLTVTYGAGTMLTINLAGTGVGAPALCYSPASVTFSPQQVGIPSSGSSFTVTNCGNANLTVSALTVAVNPTEFSETDNCGSRPFTLAAGAFCTVNAVFTPNGTGTRNGTVRATDNATGSPQSQPLSGDGFNSIIPPETIMIKGSVVITGGVVIGGPPN